jgi:hypothetical protein
MKIYKNNKGQFIKDGIPMPTGVYFPSVRGSELQISNSNRTHPFIVYTEITTILQEDGTPYESIEDFMNKMGMLFQNIVDIGGNFNLNVSRGLFLEIGREFKFGEHLGLGTTEEVICYNGGNYDFIPFFTAEFLNVSSTSVLDVNAGQGAWDLMLIGLDILGAPQTEVVLMNGTTVVVSTKKFSRINRCIVLHSGTTTATADANQGDITVVSAVTTYVLANIKAHNGKTTQAVYTVPKGFTAYVNNVTFNVGQGKECTFTSKYRNALEPDSAFVLSRSFTVYQNTYNSMLEYPVKFLELTDLVVTGKMASTPVATAHASFEMILIRN